MEMKKARRVKYRSTRRVSQIVKRDAHSLEGKPPASVT
jgi:hypothetical protein